jgi:N-acetyl-alpha-D-glucosaminyl L-malate synthase BshA
MVAHAGVGGSGTVAAELAHGLAERGHQVHLIVAGRPPRLPPGSRVQLHLVEVIEHPMWPTAPWTLPLMSLIAEVASAERLDLLHAHFAVPYAIAADLARELLDRPVPLVVTLHGSDVTQLAERREYRALIQRAVRNASAVTVPSLALRVEAEARFGTTQPITVIPNFVDSARFRPSADRSAPSGSALLVHASNFRAVKRVEDVVAVFQGVATRANARLLLLGDGPRRGAALAELDRLGLGDRVEAHRAVPDVESWLGRAHVALLPSEQESFGLAALEALACGVPVVGSRVGGLPEVVAHGETGWLEPVGSVQAMAERVLSLVGDAAEWQRMSTAARHRAITCFPPAVAFEAYEAVYRAAALPS